MDEMQVRDDVDYLEKTVLDSSGRIFRNLHRKFSYQKLLLFTPKPNGDNELVKVIFIRFFE